jgi:hypothetical protein
MTSSALFPGPAISDEWFAPCQEAGQQFPANGSLSRRTKRNISNSINVNKLPVIRFWFDGPCE